MKKVIKNTVIILIILTLSVSTALLTYLHFFAPDGGGRFRVPDLSGEWVGNLDMTERAAAAALCWLQEIEAVSVSLEDMEYCMRELTVQVNLTMEQTVRAEETAEGTFRCYVLPESYDACNQAAYEAFAAAFRSLLTERLRMAGYTGGTDEESVEALIIETFGMSTVAYLMSCAPALLPSLEELQDWYDGSGTYEASEGVLTRRFDAGGAAVTKEECYIRKDAVLLLSEEAGAVQTGPFPNGVSIIYTLQQPENQEPQDQQP